MTVGGDESTALVARDEEDGLVSRQHRAVVPRRSGGGVLTAREEEDGLVAVQHKGVLPFILPAIFTVCPRADSLLKYARLILSFHDTSSTRVVESEARALAMSMTMEEDIIKGTKQFMQRVFDKVHLELDRFGLHVYNANVKQPVVGPKLTRQNAAKFDAETKNLSISTQRGKEQELKLESMNALTATEKLKAQEANSAMYGKQKAAYLGQK
ncbi:hypothetical protein SASPL_138628 [Salvia splendens]|uniref:Flotillin-like n=1 Tax=Salvia splendens TaxID=180675 RepID=A0A8X8WXA7_SALSN|nr:hypothetical protein SASPL_138628 [Salvia splendens]